MHSTFRRWLPVSFAAGLLLFGLVSTTVAQEKFYRPQLDAKYLEGSLRVDWYGVYQKDKKIGYLRNERKRVDDKYVEEQLMSMKLVSFGQKIEISTAQTMVFEPAPTYRLVKAVLTEKNGPMAKKTTFTWNNRDRSYTTVHEVAGEARKSVLNDIDYTLGDASATEVWVRGKPKVGSVMLARSFDPGEQKMDAQTNKILTSKTSLAGGVKVHFYEVETVSKLRDFKTLARYDDHGTTLSADVLIFELRKETEEQAKDTQYSQDLFVMGMVKIDKGLGRTGKVAELVVAVDGKEAEVFEDGPRQSVVATDNGRLVRLGKKYGKEQKATDAEIKEALAETNAYPITHAKIKDLADQVTEGARTPEAKVAKIVAFVHKYVRPHLSAQAPEIHDLLKSKKGDCKSYALMFNNLARAAGVPAREVSGLLYVGDDFKAFGGHAWNEVVLNGVWVPVDASMGETEVNATHICFGTEHRATKNLLTTLGKLSFRLVEVKSAE
jgi:protein-glutamine gamma-glutamyltransferase